MILENINIDIDMVILENIDIDIDIDKAILQNIDINKISNRFKFGISNRAIFIGSSSVYPWRRRRQSRRGKRSVEKVVGNNHCFDGAIELVMEFICQTPFSSNFTV